MFRCLDGVRNMTAPHPARRPSQPTSTCAHLVALVSFAAFIALSTQSASAEALKTLSGLTLTPIAFSLHTKNLEQSSMSKRAGETELVVYNHFRVRLNELKATAAQLRNQMSELPTTDDGIETATSLNQQLIQVRTQINAIRTQFEIDSNSSVDEIIGQKTTSLRLYDPYTIQSTAGRGNYPYGALFEVVGAAKGVFETDDVAWPLIKIRPESLGSEWSFLQFTYRPEMGLRAGLTVIVVSEQSSIQSSMVVACHELKARDTIFGQVVPKVVPGLTESWLRCVLPADQGSITFRIERK